jgi:dihydroorotate dehydrogenase electron transfer subunit
MIDAVVRDNRSLGGRGALVSTFAEGVAVTLRPGEFVTARAWEGHDPLLRRPLAPFDVQVEDGGTRIDLLVVAGGRGTRRLAHLAPGDRVSLLGPLGRPFSPLREDRVTVLVAGGVGVAPLYHLVREAREAGSRAQVHAVIGARDASLLYGAPELEALGIPCTLATDTGDAGFHGNAVQAFRHGLEGIDSAPVVYGCGPEPMLEALVALCRERGLEGEVSIERHMGCGFGVCYTCACRVVRPDGTTQRVRACLEGPVFRIGELAPDGW